MRYQDEAKKIINLLKDFDKQDFEDWVINNCLIVGSNNLLQYLDEKERWNTKCLPKISNMNIKISTQTKLILKYLPEIDIQDLKNWFSNSISINKKDIISYINSKEKLNNIIQRGAFNG